MKKARSVGDYLKQLDPAKRAALQKLRRTIKATVPKAEEGISYGIPAVRYDGRWLMGFGAGANHCAIYAGAYPIRLLKSRLKKYSTSKGTIRFSPDAPLPDSLVRKIVRARVAEQAGRAGRAG